MRSNGVREIVGRRALVAASVGVVVLACAPVLGMGVMAGWGPAGPSGHEATGQSAGEERASLVGPDLGRWARIFPAESLIPTPGSAVLAGLGVLVAVVRRRG